MFLLELYSDWKVRVVWVKVQELAGVLVQVEVPEVRVVVWVEVVEVEVPEVRVSVAWVWEVLVELVSVVREKVRVQEVVEEEVLVELVWVVEEEQGSYGYYYSWVFGFLMNRVPLML